MFLGNAVMIFISISWRKLPLLVVLTLILSIFLKHLENEE